MNYGTQSYSTISYEMLSDLLMALRHICSEKDYIALLHGAGLEHPDDPQKARVSREQIVMLYRSAALVTGDEMMGLWSRPIRNGALKQICSSILGARSMGAGINRFTTFWNLVLDDYALDLSVDANHATLSLTPRQEGSIQRFGHMLMLKLTHGLASWLIGREMPVARVQFAFAKPAFAQDYSVLFPAECQFSKPHSSISFETQYWRLPIQRDPTELQDFLTRAPRDWIFTSFKDHTYALRVREILSQSGFSSTVSTASAALNLTPRTLMRRLDQEGSSYQDIKDNLRRDLAISALHEGQAIEAIAQDLGFSSASTFHRAFRQWTGQTPGRFIRT